MQDASTEMTGQSPSANWRDRGWIAAAAGLCFFLALGTPRLWDEDEGFFAAAAREMHQRNDWVVPTFNGELFSHKPPFMFWMMRGGFFLFGETELGARVGSALFALLTALATYQIGCLLFRRNAGLWAGLAVATSLNFTVVARAATPDAYLVFFIALAIWLYIRSVPKIWQSQGDNEWTWRDLLPERWTGYLGIYAAMGVAVLVKGPIGVLLPGTAIGLFAIFASGPRSAVEASLSSRALGVFRTLFSATPWRVFFAMRPLLAIAVVLAIAGPWFFLVGWRTDGVFLQEFFGVHNVGRFLEPMENHRGGPWYYIIAAIVGFFPWSIFWLPTTIDTCRAIFRRSENHLALALVASWAVVVIGFFSLASTKLPSYILPAYPALALATGHWVDRWLSRSESVWTWWPRLAFGSLGIVGLGMVTIIPALLLVKIDGEPLIVHLDASSLLVGDVIPLTLVGIPPLVAAAACLVLNERGERRLAVTTFATFAALFTTSVVAGLAVRLDQHQPIEAVITAAGESSDTNSGKSRIAVYGCFQPSMVFYADEPVQVLDGPEAVQEFLSGTDKGVLVTSQRAFSGVGIEGAPVLYSRPGFPKPGELIVLGQGAVQTAKVPSSDAVAR